MRAERDPARGLSSLPPGQRALTEFPRFGVIAFARRPLESAGVRLELGGSLIRPVLLGATELATLPRVKLTADFHCAAGWSYRAAHWSGFRFADLWQTFIAPYAPPSDANAYAVLRCADRYRTSLPLQDLLAPDVLIADRLDDQPLSVEHGAPLRLVAPAHYGYKSAKHLVAIELRCGQHAYRPLLPRLLDHPRARVELEERGQFLPGWLLRYVFRPLIRPMIRRLQLITQQNRSHQ